MSVPRRFSGVARLYGEAAYYKFQSSHVCVVGLGGVGSWVVEALVRSGIGEITMIDMDHVAESNVNRQLPALSSTLGRSKIEVLRERLLDISPQCKIHLIDNFVDKENAAALISKDYDIVADCIDVFRIKAAMIAMCRDRGQAIVTVGGAGGQIDPTQIQVSDLYVTAHDKLLSQTRRLLRREYGFPRNLKKKFGISCVWSKEITTDTGGDEVCESSLNCAGFGSSMAVTTTFAMATAAQVLKELGN